MSGRRLLAKRPASARKARCVKSDRRSSYLGQSSMVSVGVKPSSADTCTQTKHEESSPETQRSEQPQSCRPCQTGSLLVDGVCPLSAKSLPRRGRRLVLEHTREGWVSLFPVHVPPQVWDSSCVGRSELRDSRPQGWDGPRHAQASTGNLGSLPGSLVSWTSATRFDDSFRALA